MDVSASDMEKVTLGIVEMMEEMIKRIKAERIAFRTVWVDKDGIPHRIGTKDEACDTAFVTKAGVVLDKPCIVYGFWIKSKRLNNRNTVTTFHLSDGGAGIPVIDHAEPMTKYDGDYTNWVTLPRPVRFTENLFCSETDLLSAIVIYKEA